MAKYATLSRRGKLFPRSCIRGNILDSSPKTNRISISVTRMRFEPGFPGRVMFGLTTRLTEFLFSPIPPRLQQSAATSTIHATSMLLRELCIKQRGE